MAEAAVRSRCAQCGGSLEHEPAGVLCLRCAMANAVSPALMEGLGDSVDRYRLQEKLGEGGCGVVYVAEQKEPIRRHVALKVIKLGMDTKAVIARFEAERQALAMMEHPNIAKVLDAGVTASGRSYFVMELVRGIRITDYCDGEKLATADRLKLFIHVCEAVQHAHQKGVIHRDLKPSNILVTRQATDASPKVIDFGIAKATEGRLGNSTVQTELHQLIGTPAYMSPEQADTSGLDMDTRSDIYSLGVLLYELLTSKTPIDAQDLASASLEAVCRRLRDHEPLRPSARLRNMAVAELAAAARDRHIESSRIIHLVRGDLDCIVMKCLEKDRTRRYQTANGLAMDVKRFLDQEPITARLPSTLYRAQKAFRRHKLEFSAAIAVATALIVGLFATSRQAVRAREAERAARSAQAAEAQSAAGVRLERDHAIRAEAEARRHELLANQAFNKARRHAYAAEINVAFQALAEHNLGRVRELVKRQFPRSGEEDLRGFEWRYLWQACQGDELVSFTDQPGQATAFSRDGKLFAYGNSEIIVRDAALRQVLTNLATPTQGLSFAPQANLLASGSSSGTTIWSTQTWQPVRVLAGTSEPTQFSPDGHWLMTGATNAVQLWSTANWQLMGTAPASQNLVVSAFSPDGSLVATPGPLASKTLGLANLAMYRVPGLEQVAELIEVPGASIGCVGFSSDGKHLYIGKWDGTLVVLDVLTRRVIATRKEHSGWVRELVFAADGNTFITGSSDRNLVIWDAATLTPLAHLHGHTGEIRSLAMSPDNGLILSGSLDGSTKLWSTHAKPSGWELDGVSMILGLLPDGRLLAASSESLVLAKIGSGLRTVTSLAPSTPEGIAGFRRKPFTASQHTLMAAIALADGSVELWQPTNSSRVARWTAHDQSVSAISFSPDDHLLATGSSSGEVKLWQTRTRRLLRLLGPLEGVVYGLAFSPDGGTLAACGQSRRIWTWDTASGEERISLENRDAAEGLTLNSVTFSPLGQLLAATTLQSNEAQIWDWHSGTQLAALKGHIQGVRHATFSPDGKTLATVSGDRKVKLWNLATYQELATFEMPGPCITVAFGRDGLTLAAGCYFAPGGGLIRLWSAPAMDLIGQ